MFEKWGYSSSGRSVGKKNYLLSTGELIVCGNLDLLPCRSNLVFRLLDLRKRSLKYSPSPSVSVLARVVLFGGEVSPTLWRRVTWSPHKSYRRVMLQVTLPTFQSTDYRKSVWQPATDIEYRSCLPREHQKTTCCVNEWRQNSITINYEWVVQKSNIKLEQYIKKAEYSASRALNRR